MKSTKSALLSALIASTSGHAAHADGAHEFDLTKKVWVDGRAVDVFVLTPPVAGGSGPAAESEFTADVKVYLVGAISEANPFGPEMKMPARDPASGEPLFGSDGKALPEVVIPAHDDTFARFVPKDAKADTYGYWIVPGPRATAADVRVRKAPANSLSGADLPYEIRLDGQWRALTDATVIERGLKEGLLAEKFSNWGGVAWLDGENAGASK